MHRNGPVARWPGRILESDAPPTSRIVSSFTCDRDSEMSVSRALLYTAIQQPPLSPPPLPQSVSRALLYTAIQQPLLSPPPSLRV